MSNDKSTVQTPHTVPIVQILDGKQAIRVTVERFTQENGKLLPEWSGGLMVYNHELEKVQEMVLELMPAIENAIKTDIV